MVTCRKCLNSMIFRPSNEQLIGIPYSDGMIPINTVGITTYSFLDKVDSRKFRLLEDLVWIDEVE